MRKYRRYALHHNGQKPPTRKQSHRRCFNPFFILNANRLSGSLECITIYSRPKQINSIFFPLSSQRPSIMLCYQTNGYPCRKPSSKKRKKKKGKKRKWKT